MTAVRVLGVDAGSATNRQAEHLIQHVISVLGLPPDALACTHFIRQGGRPHVAITVEVPGAIDLDLAALDAATSAVTGAAIGDVRHGPADFAAAAAYAMAEHAARRSGRAVRYRGAAELIGTLTADAIVTRSAIDRIDVLAAGGPPAPGALVDTRGYVRPEWRDGVLALLTMPAGDGRLAPFEVPNPTPCCADHA